MNPETEQMSTPAACLRTCARGQGCETELVTMWSSVGSRRRAAAAGPRWRSRWRVSSSCVWSSNSCRGVEPELFVHTRRDLGKVTVLSG
ncbi:hypothetical protein E2562_018047 [Oryza meyeriana var. granulata]|uniref:Uncharacterized protein n=1 Tax=Oryza meyeriana var. granulata TaxID=110450 RepID=A0A6G1CPL7_9ORYZ|nr:hypothetical protein E2562_018047 [Oryza meyeriana var. granulata]